MPISGDAAKLAGLAEQIKIGPGETRVRRLIDTVSSIEKACDIVELRPLLVA